MSSLVRQSRADSPISRKPIALVAAALTLFCAFLLIPGSIATKTHLVLHGICAQRPSHSLQLGDATLPLDARMSGLYLGMVTTGLWLFATNRLRSTRAPGRWVIALLVCFMVVLALDGFNALAVDLGLPHPYEPSNTLRLATGILGGIALGCLVASIFAASMWARTDRHQSLVSRPVEFLPPLGIAAALGGLALTGLPILYAPFAIGLMAAAVSVFAVMAMMVMALVTGRGWTGTDFRDLAPMASAGLIAALLMMGGLSWLRVVAESASAIPRLT